MLPILSNMSSEKEVQKNGVGRSKIILEKKVGTIQLVKGKKKLVDYCGAFATSSHQGTHHSTQ